RWYLGRVVERRTDSPAGVVLRLEGMASQLETIFPGGYGSDADGVAPHRYGCPELFPADPDAVHENIDCVDRPEDLIRRLLEQYVVSGTEIILDDDLIEDATTATELAELKVRGTETAASILRDLALRARNASWGVDEQGRFYLLQRRDSVAAEWREGRDLVSLREIENEHRQFNRVLLTGGYVYADCGTPPCGTYRWQGNYLQPLSRSLYGEHRIRLSVPWIRTSTDSQAFVREFFRVYAQPTPQYRIDVDQQSFLVRPWLSSIQVLDRAGNELATGQPEVVRVEFDHAPNFRIDLGPLDPRTLWPVPRDGDVWPIAPSDVPGFGGGPLDVTSDAASSSSVDVISSDSSGTSTDGFTDCYHCAKVAKRWKVTFSGIQPGVCPDCDLINGEWILERSSAYSYCVWTSPHPACAGRGLANEIRLSFTEQNIYLFLVTRSVYAVKYRPQNNVFHCFGPNIFEVVSPSSMCSNYPATVIVEPV
ncbi:MAG TPA: hypothetical protein VM165_23475, partial [Planctomycetaceae bacterium]|nr:hypothetical protein [Planctomycetaceae bacterium]